MIIRLFLIAAFLLAPGMARAQFGGGATEGYILFKDGFTIHGRIVQQKQREVDPSSGIAIFIPSPNGFTFIDDEVRCVYFPPGQIENKGIVALKPGELVKDQIMLTKTPPPVNKPLMLPAWRFKDVPPFDKYWQREIVVLNPTSFFPMRQRIVQLSPERMRIQSTTHNWDVNYFTKELPLGELTRLITDYFEVKKKNKDKDFKDFSDGDVNFVIAKFYQQMGHLEDAERLAKDVLAKAPEHKKKIEDFLDLLEREKAKKFGADFEPLAAAKQHRTIIEKLAEYEKKQLIDKVPDPVKLLAQDLKNKYDADNEKLDKVKKLIQFLMSKRPDERVFWLDVTTTILSELNYDTLSRLDTFVTFAEQYERDLAQNKVPNIKLEDVLALALTGWHLGNIAAEPDVALGHKLWSGRRFLRDYMRADTVGQRSILSEAWAKETNLPIDVVARMLQHLPPPNAHSKLSSEVMTLNLDLPDAPMGSYLVQLPPDYHHQRAHPLLMLIHGDREAPETLLKRWAPLAARNGFILAAPLWKKFSPKFYASSDAEQTYFMNCLKDLKRRFQVDTDRVFLFGWSNGAEMAWDVGLSHPDQFAGLLPMCGVPNAFSKKYWQNAQNLGLYIVDGDKSGAGPSVVLGLFKDWVRFNYNAYFLLYKGRGNELFVGEFEPMMDWMNRKKRKYPSRELASFNNAGVISEEFRSHRQSDNRFYWLSSDEIKDNYKQDAYNWVNNRSPAQFQGAITVSNNADAKGKALIHTNIALRLQGLKQCTVWLSPSMIDFTKPVQMHINGKPAGMLRNVAPSIPTMLEDYFLNVDRQRLYHARIDLKL